MRVAVLIVLVVIGPSAASGIELQGQVLPSFNFIKPDWSGTVV